MKKNYMIILIIALALAIRLIYVGSLIGKPIDDMSDDKDYDLLASSLAAGKGYVDASGNPTARRAPLTAVFFGLVYSVFGHSIPAVRYAQASLSALTCLVIYLIGRALFTKREALLAASIAAIYPSFIIFTGMLLCETLLVFLIALSVYLLLRKKGRPLINYFLSGISFGLAALTRPSLLLLPLFIILAFAISRAVTPKDLGKKALCLTIAMLITISPWTLRCYHVHKKFILVNTELGLALISGYFYPKAGFGFQNPELANMVAKGIKDETELSRVLTGYVIRNVMKDPYRFIKLLPLKFLWEWEPFDGRGCGFSSSYNIVYGLTFLFFLFGVAGSRVVWKNLLPLYAAIGYSIFIALAFFGCRRYRMEIEPFIILFAAHGVSWALGEAKKNRAILILLIMGLAANFIFFFRSDSIKTFSRKAARIFGYTAFSKERR